MHLGRLGSGGMGVVYEVDDRERGGRVALKTLRQVQDGDAVLRFKQEFRSLQDLQHPNLVALYELGQLDGQLYFTMELIDGVNLLQFVRPDDPHVAAMAISSTMTGGAMPPEEQTLDLKTAGPTELPLPQPPTLQGAGAVDLPRLRHTLPQLLSALGALHAGHKVHRDLKPSNILVTPDGRVVLLDFGVISDVGFDELAGEGAVVGTAAYMAPEQGEGKRVGPEADLYSVGVVLYQALTGRLPFSGNHQDVLAEKVRADPPRPRLFAPDAPEDLEALCLALLQRDPAARPTVRQALATLGIELGEDRSEPPSEQPVFVGRKAELDVLLAALSDVQRGAAISILVEGESGVGKSALTRQLLARVMKPAVVLAGRCYERESVPYKAIDGVIDSLSRYLMSLPSDERAALLPENAPLLAAVFPVLRRVDGLAGDSERRFVIDPQQQRQLLFATLRELFVRIADARSLVVAIDDLQWADADSRALLEALMRPPHAPRCLFVGTTRPIRDVRTPLRLAGDVRTIALQALPADDARSLAEHLLAGADPQAARRIAEEAAGHPLFIDELVRQRGTAGATGGARLEDALWDRITRLPADARALLEMVAVAGVPVRHEVASLAAVADLPELGRRVRLLAIERLLRSTGLGKDDLLEPYHDRVRESLQSKLTPDEQRGWHARLALALERTGRFDSEALAVHWQSAGEPGRAYEYFGRAAAEAERALAFDRAARLYRQALDVVSARADRAELGLDSPAGLQLRERLGVALANAGRGAEASAALLDASTSKSAPPARALELKRQAGEQLLRAGHIDEGMAIIRQVLDAVGVWLPKRPIGSLVSLLYRRALLRIRGLGYTPRAATEISAEELQRVDVCLSTSVGMGTVDTIRGADFQARALWLALRSGEKSRIARTMAMEAGHVSANGYGTEERVEKLVRASQALAQELGDPHTLALSQACEGITAFLLGDWRRGADRCEAAYAIFRDQCTGVQWEMTNTALFFLWSLTYLGELRRMRELITRLIREAEEYGNRYAATNMRTGSLNFIWLMGDDPDLARREAAVAMGNWSQEGFHHQHWDDLLAQGEIDLYCRDGKTAWERVQRTWPALKRSLLLMIQLSRIEAVHLRGRAALAYAETMAASDRKPYLKQAQRDGKSLVGEKSAWAQPFAHVLFAGVASLSGDRSAMLHWLDEAFRGFAETETIMYREATRYRRGEHRGGTDGAAEMAMGRKWFVDQGVANVERFVDMLLPGFVAPPKQLAG